MLRTTIDKDGVIPYYVQLRDALEEHIRSGNWKSGDRLPGEIELCELFDVSRTVVRQALKDMTYAGLIRREKGRGTFVSEPKISSRSLVQSLDGFYQDMADKGFTPIARVLEQGIVPSNAKVAGYLKIEPMSPVVKIVRLRFIEDEPIVLVTSYLPYEMCREVINADLTRQSLYAFLEHQCGLTIGRGRRSIDAVSANENEAELLKIAVGSPLLLIDSISFLNDGTPVEYFHGLFRGDRLRFEAEIVEIRGQGTRWNLSEEDSSRFP
ncbi:MAG: GntR family transcriptional regulator [Anaerolineales bacterium]|nr:GntR family transcriptional regulator [Anaerolineales bacterium]